MSNTPQMPPRLKAISLVAITADTPGELAEKTTRCLEEGLDLYGHPIECKCGWVQYVTEVALVVPQAAEAPDSSRIVPASFIPKT